MKTPDLEYFTTGLFTRFMPNTKAGEVAWTDMHWQNNGAAILTIHAANVIKQLRDAGYTVAKAKKPTQSIDHILAELEV